MENPKSIDEILTKVDGRHLILPAIQRNFVWNTEQIEKLFDSLMQEYPIGMFLFWKRSEEALKDMKVYNIPAQYEEGVSRKAHELQKLSIKGGANAVLDGQQRITALYIALKGSYIIGNRRKTEKELYLNLLGDSISNVDKNNNKYQFKFLTKQQADTPNANELWYKVKDILVGASSEKKNAHIFQKANELSKGNPELFQKIHILLEQLYDVVYKSGIHIYTISEDKQLDDVLEIFVRVNSQGEVLTKTDLLISSLSMDWETVLTDFEKALEDINGIRFNFDKDFLMRIALACLEEKSVKFTLETFRDKKKINMLKEQWDNIILAFENATTLLKDWNLSKDSIIADSAIVPIVYFCFVKKRKPSDEEAQFIKNYLILSQLLGIFGKSSDTTIDNMLNSLRESKCSFESVLKNNEQIFKLNQLDLTIEECLEAKKGKLTRFILTILDKNKEEDKIFHQDHLHPDFQFSNENLKSLSKEQQEEWQRKKDLLPNLHLLEGRRNQKKNKIPLSTWVSDSNIDEQIFKQNNHIGCNISLNFEDFEQFFNDRKENIKDLLKQELQ